MTAGLAGLASALTALVVGIGTWLLQRSQARQAETARVSSVTEVAMAAAGDVVAMLRQQVEDMAARITALETTLTAEREVTARLTRSLADEIRRADMLSARVVYLADRLAGAGVEVTNGPPMPGPRPSR